MLATGTLTSDLIVLVPVGSMIIANAMNACAQAMERFRADVLAHVGQIETGLSLGADPATTVAPYVQSAVYASLLPRLDMLKSLGLVWIPGVMAGMLVSGASPVYAGIFQFIIVAMILSASGIAGSWLPLCSCGRRPSRAPRNWNSVPVFPAPTRTRSQLCSGTTTDARDQPNSPGPMTTSTRVQMNPVLSLGFPSCQDVRELGGVTGRDLRSRQ